MDSINNETNVTNETNATNETNVATQAKSIRDPPINTHYRQFLVNFNEKLIPYLIGKDGVHFKRITTMSRTKYIWWNNETKIIEIWGPERNLFLAEKILKDHIIFIQNKFKNKIEEAL